MSGVDVNDPVQVGIHLAELKGSMSAMQQQQTHNAEVARTAIDGVNARLDDLTRKFDGIATMSGSTVSHTEQLGRMWGTVAKTDRLAEALKNMAMGGMFVLALTASLAAYLYQGDKASTAASIRTIESSIKTNDERLDRLEVYLSGPRTESFKR